MPDDVSVTGFDDIDLAAFTLPRLTTVRQDTDAIGAAAVTTLLDIIDGGTPPPILLQTEVVVRRSTAAPRA
ncbi:substrate-binding domain-containing protein [Dactylosporangium sp. NPDC006015]|uniref:substrate-binding domain-containing protein n=1 Tax=Dactylosporangium sp. NPDC006015 TaxID=3154576 RepID=UPI0033B843AB